MHSVSNSWSLASAARLNSNIARTISTPGVSTANALLSRATLQAPVTIRLEEHGHWFRPESTEPRIGTRSAIAAVVATGQGPVCAVSVHRESDANAAYRAGQMCGLLDQIDTLVGDMPVILGGDLNTGLADDGDFDKETLFAEAAARGYERHGGPLDHTTTRASQVSRNPQRAYKLDWFLTRRLEVKESRIVAALAADGTVLSDHEMIVASIAGIT
jgi:endonuclease/exonuclease/phosphatase family metal-dependent hydrolase